MTMAKQAKYKSLIEGFPEDESAYRAIHKLLINDVLAKRDRLCLSTAVLKSCASLKCHSSASLDVLNIWAAAVSVLRMCGTQISFRLTAVTIEKNAVNLATAAVKAGNYQIGLDATSQSLFHLFKESIGQDNSLDDFLLSGSVALKIIKKLCTSKNTSASRDLRVVVLRLFYLHLLSASHLKENEIPTETVYNLASSVVIPFIEWAGEDQNSYFDKVRLILLQSASRSGCSGDYVFEARSLASILDRREPTVVAEFLHKSALAYIRRSARDQKRVLRSYKTAWRHLFEDESTVRKAVSSDGGEGLFAWVDHFVTLSTKKEGVRLLDTLHEAMKSGCSVRTRRGNQLPIQKGRAFSSHDASGEDLLQPFRDILSFQKALLLNSVPGKADVEAFHEKYFNDRDFSRLELGSAYHLRLVRVLEPHRRAVCSKNMLDGKHVILLFLRVFEDGEKLSTGLLSEKFRKAKGVLLESYQWVLTCMLREHEGEGAVAESYNKITQSIVSMSKRLCNSTRDDHQCATWAAKVIHNSAVSLYNQKMARRDKTGLRLVGEMMEHGLRCLEVYSDEKCISKRVAHTITSFVGSGALGARDAVRVAWRGIEYLSGGGDATSDLIVALGRATVLKSENGIQLDYTCPGGSILGTYYNVLRRYERYLRRRGFARYDRRLKFLMAEQVEMLTSLRKKLEESWVLLAEFWLRFLSESIAHPEVEVNELIEEISGGIEPDCCSTQLTRFSIVLARLLQQSFQERAVNEGLEDLEILWNDMPKESDLGFPAEEVYYLAMEISLWASVKLDVCDWDDCAVRLMTVAGDVASLLNLGKLIPALRTSELLRRLGLITRASCLLKAEEASFEELIQRAKISNDLFYFSDARATLLTCQRTGMAEEGSVSDLTVAARAHLHSAMAISLLHGDMNPNAGLEEALEGLKRLLAVTRSQSGNGINIGGVIVSVAENENLKQNLKSLGEVLLQVAEDYARINLRFQAGYYMEKARQVSEQVDALGNALLSALTLYLYLDSSAGNLLRISKLSPESMCPLVNPLLRARVIMRMGDALFSNGDIDSALMSYAEVLGLLRNVPYETKVAISLSATANIRRGYCYYKTDKLKLAEKAFKMALRCRLAPEDRALALLGLSEISLAHVGRDSLDEAWSVTWGRRCNPDQKMKYALQVFGDARSKLESAETLISRHKNCTDHRLLRKIRMLRAELTLGQDVSKAIHFLVSAQRPALNLRRSFSPGAGAAQYQTLEGNVLGSISPGIAAHEESEAEVARDFEGMSISLSSTSLWKEVQQILPVNWILVGLTINELKTHMLVWRVRRDRYSCLARMALPECGSGASYAELKGRFIEIMDSMKSSAGPEDRREISEIEKALWWQKRFNLDSQLKSILLQVEKSWLQGAVALLLPPISDTTDDGNSKFLSCDLASIVRCYPDVLDKEQILTLERIHIEDGGTFRASDVLRDLDVKGTRQRLRTKSATQASSTRRLRSGRDISNDRSEEEGRLILMIDSELEWIPWESMPSLRQHTVAATRILDLESLQRCAVLGSERFKTREVSRGFDVQINARSTYYILNPTGDLSKTERTFAQAFYEEEGWKGVVGKEEEALRDVTNEVASRDIFIYCGHGGGESIVSTQRLESERKAPVALLMGCSSAKLRAVRNGFGLCESAGTVIDYILAGAPAVLGNLWDVTDRDLDRLTASLLGRWLGLEKFITDSMCAKRVDLSQALAKARDACKLPYLVAAATVQYGLPGITTA